MEKRFDTGLSRSEPLGLSLEERENPGNGSHDQIFKKRAGWKAKVALFLALWMGGSAGGGVEAKTGSIRPVSGDIAVAVKAEVEEYYSTGTPDASGKESNKELPEAGQGKNIFGMHVEINRQRLDERTEIEIKQLVLSLLEQVNQQEIEKNGNGQAIFYEAYVNAGNNISLEGLFTHETGQLGDELERRNPKLGRIIKIGSALGSSQGGKLGRIAEEINTSLGIQVAPERQVYKEVSTQPFTVNAVVDRYRQNENAEADPVTHQGTTVTLPYFITTERVDSSEIQPNLQQRGYARTTRYRLYMAEQLSDILGTDAHGQKVVKFPDNGIDKQVIGFKPFVYGQEFPDEASAHEAAVMYALIFAQLQALGRESQVFMQNYEKLAGQEALNTPIEIPLTESQKESLNLSKNAKNTIKLNQALVPGQQLSIEVRNKKYIFIVLGCKSDGHNNFDVEIALLNHK